MKGLYIHIPFCIKKCKYCDFNSFSACEKEKSAYLNALFLEMEKYKGEVVDTIFIGGGTPTSLSPEQLENLLKNIRDTFVLAENYEFTIEANPKTLDAEKLQVLKKYGVQHYSRFVQKLRQWQSLLHRLLPLQEHFSFKALLSILH